MRNMQQELSSHGLAGKIFAKDEIIEGLPEMVRSKNKGFLE